MDGPPPQVRLAPSSIVHAAFILVGTVGAVLLALQLVSVLVTVFLAIVLAETIRPLVRILEQRRVPRALAILSIYLGIASALIGALALVVPPLVQQVQSLAREAPGSVQALRDRLPELYQLLADLGLSSQIQNALGQLAGQATPLLRAIAVLPAQVVGGAVTLLSGFVLAGFWIGLTDRANRSWLERLAPARQAQIRALAADLSQTLGGWLRGQLVLMLFVGTLSFVGLLALGIRYPVALAVWAGLTEIFPIIGPLAGMVPAVLVAASISPLHAVAVVVLYLVVQQVENQFLVPKVMQRAVGLHPFIVLVALLIGGSLLGLAGIIIAVPVAASIQVLIARFWLPPPACDGPAGEGAPPGGG